MLFMTQSLERAGDHAKNLAEEVCHLVSGHSVRHVLRAYDKPVEQMFIEDLKRRQNTASSTASAKSHSREFHLKFTARQFRRATNYVCAIQGEAYVPSQLPEHRKLARQTSNASSCASATRERHRGMAANLEAGPDR